MKGKSKKSTYSTTFGVDPILTNPQNPLRKGVSIHNRSNSFAVRGFEP